MKKLCSFLSLLILLGVTVLTCIDVFGRYILDHALNGTTEITEISIAILVFIMFPYVCFKGDHVKADILSRFYSKKWLTAQDTVTDLVFAFGLFFVGISLYEFALKSYQRNEVSEYLSIPLWLVPAIISISSFFTISLLFYRHLRVVKTYFKKGDHSS